MDISGEINITIFSDSLGKFMLLSDEERRGAVVIKATIRISGEDEDQQKRDIQVNNIFSINDIDIYIGNSLKVMAKKNEIESFGKKISRINKIADMNKWEEAVLIAVIETSEEKTSKNGKIYARASLTDISGKKNTVLFEEQINKFKEFSELEQQEPLGIKIKVSKIADDGSRDIMISDMFIFNEDNIKEKTKRLNKGVDQAKIDNAKKSDELENRQELNNQNIEEIQTIFLNSVPSREQLIEFKNLIDSGKIKSPIILSFNFNNQIFKFKI